jgi:hypothetical protein
LGFTAGLRALGIAALGAVSILTVAAPSVAAAGPTASVSTAAVRVVHIAELQRGKRYAFGAAGPSAFDCSGLVRYAYLKAGVNSRLGGGHSGHAMLVWGRAHHLVSRSNPQIGDVVIYGNGAHAAIYIGHGRVISALNPTQGIRVTALHALHLPVTGFIHTHLSKVVKPVVTPPSTAAKATAKATYVRTLVYAHLRTASSTVAHVVATVRPGVRLRLLGTKVAGGKRWDHVVYRTHSVWVRADLVRAG